MSRTRKQRHLAAGHPKPWQELPSTEALAALGAAAGALLGVLSEYRFGRTG
ncbi:hypothetical protein AB0M45_32185 [Nocardia sp. NPDC051787]|uniref:hypothetical protein n=1 Tax=Nocardia sp. NPDC051787 TaxID=3155415 RepID=UPI003414B7A3